MKIFVQLKTAFDFRRNCYFEDERKLNYFNKYSRADCVEECYSDKIYELCHCAPYHIVRKYRFFKDFSKNINPHRDNCFTNVFGPSCVTLTRDWVCFGVLISNLTLLKPILHKPTKRDDKRQQTSGKNIFKIKFRESRAISDTIARLYI